MTRRQLRPRPFLRDSTPRIQFAAPRRRWGRHLVATVLVGGAGVLAVASLPASPPDAAAQPGDRGAAPAAERSRRDPVDVAAGPDIATGQEEAVVPPAVFARYGGIDLHLPSEDVLLVGFHEASLPGALELTPHGVARANDNTTRVTPPPDDPDGPGYVILSSRGRVQAATSAVDLVMRDDDTVRSPVDGIVTDVREYALYGSHPDTRIEITPAGHPDLRVVLIHLAGVEVAAGDTVAAGVTPLADSANRFPFASHVDRYLGERWPHVHVEVKHPDAIPE